MRDQNDNVIEDNLTWSIVSNIESDLHTTNTTLMPVVAGEHTLTIRAVYIPTEDDFVDEEDIPDCNRARFPIGSESSRR